MSTNTDPTARLRAITDLLSAHRGATHPLVQLGRIALEAGNASIHEATALHLEDHAGDRAKAALKLTEAYLERLRLCPVETVVQFDVDLVDALSARDKTPLDRARAVRQSFTARPLDLPTRTSVRVIFGPDVDGVHARDLLVPVISSPFGLADEASRVAVVIDNAKSTDGVGSVSVWGPMPTSAKRG